VARRRELQDRPRLSLADLTASDQLTQKVGSQINLDLS
jgi:hypothetical protein